MNQRVSKRPWFLGLFAALGFACSSDSSTGQDVIPTPPPMEEAPKVVFSEIMYNPVDEQAYDDNHEFLELFNRSDSPVDMSNWKLSGTVQFTFPSGTTLAPGAYLVLAKNKSALAAVASYQISASDIVGEYTGDLDNGGAVINLLNAESTLVESVEYHVDFPWPIGADGLGADDEWLSRLPTPLTSAPHQYKGISLQRVNYDLAASVIANWTPSPLDGASPGRANSTTGLPPTIVERKIVAAQSGNVLIRSTDTVKISVVFSNLIPFAKPQLQWFVDDLQATGEPVTTVDLVANNGFYEATLPKQPNNAIVRYRILVDKGAGSEVISPRPSDPLTWWAYFVTPPVNTSAPVYSLFIKKEDWTQIYDNVNWPTPDDKRVSPGGSPANRCLLRDSWDSQVPAVFVVDGIVYDTFVRYEGSRWNRTNGIGLDITKTTINPLPVRPTSPTVLSWKIDFPAYAPYEGKRRKMVLNKLNQACPGLDDQVGERLYGDPSVNVPVQKAKYARLHINGGYYHYMLDGSWSDGVPRLLASARSHGDPFLENPTNA